MAWKCIDCGHYLVTIERYTMVCRSCGSQEIEWEN